MYLSRQDVGYRTRYSVRWMVVKILVRYKLYFCLIKRFFKVTLQSNEFLKSDTIILCLQPIFRNGNPIGALILCRVRMHHLIGTITVFLLGGFSVALWQISCMPSRETVFVPDFACYNLSGACLLCLCYISVIIMVLAIAFFLQYLFCIRVIKGTFVNVFDRCVCSCGTLLPI